MRPSGKLPLAVGVPEGARACLGARTWRSRRAQPVLPAHPHDVDLGQATAIRPHRSCRSSRIAGARPERACSRPIHDARISGRGQSLLHHGGQRAHAGTGRRCVSCHSRSDRRFERARRQRRRMPQQAAADVGCGRSRHPKRVRRTARCSRRSHTTSSRSQFFRPCRAVSGEPADHGLRPAVQHREPQALLPGQRASGRGEDLLGASSPSAGDHLVAHETPRYLELAQLTPGEDSGLRGGELRPRLHAKESAGICPAGRGVLHSASLECGSGRLDDHFRHSRREGEGRGVGE